MKKLISDWEWLSIRILILGLTVFLWSYITEIPGVTKMFGDWEEVRGSGFRHYWGFRHYVYTSTFGLLTVVQIFRIAKWVNIRVDDKGFEIKNK